MITLSIEALSYLHIAIWNIVAVFLRVGAFVSILPAFGERMVPGRVRLVVAISFAAIVAPAVPAIAPPDTFLQFASLSAVETLTGLLFGFAIRIFALALQTAGTIAAQATSLSQILGAANADPAPAMSHLLVVSGLALAVMTGLHVRAAELLILSYDLVPGGMRADGQDISGWATSNVAKAFSLAFLLSAPFVIASFIYNLAMGVINRAMPQLMVAFVGAPAITWGGLALLFVSAPLILSVWLRHFYETIGVQGGSFP